ncbi:MAG: hypothetical protein N2C14_19605, partial [Planctomycetales bacterium]
GQPMNLNFDVRGRLWITHTSAYPYPARGEGVEPRSAKFAGIGDHPPRDKLTVLGMIGPDGKPGEITHFAEGLNIPIGQTPLGDGGSALVFSMPNIHRCVDADGDGKSDRREKLYGRFGNVDAHGMSNSYTRWIDGWIYGCHGFSNYSEVGDSTGGTVKLRSGNTYRFREDGSRFEQFTWGQVNPFGLTFDPWGNLFSADCHTKPVYLLLQGAMYPHFGAKPVALGFGPTMIGHTHGSTGICGPAYYAADHFPPDYRGNLFLCNPVTGRVHRDKLKRFGSTLQADTQPDFISCDDPWFRPVDAAVGPDGALYVADFYNAVIGHYEVPLNHPKRDRRRGRIWRIVYRGNAAGAKPLQPSPDLTKLDAKQLAALLASRNLVVRTLVANYLVDLGTADAATAARSVLQEKSSSAEQRSHALWVVERLTGLDDATAARLAKDAEPLVRVHLTRALAERSAWKSSHFETVRAALADSDGFARRTAASALAQHIHADNVRPLLAAWSAAPPDDTHLIHAVRLALRAHVEQRDVASVIASASWDKDESRRLAGIAATARNDAATGLLLTHSAAGNLDAGLLRKAAPSVARHGSPEQLSRLIGLVQESFPNDPPGQFEFFELIHGGLTERGVRPREHPAAKAWFARLGPELLTALEKPQAAWTNHPAPDVAASESPWGLRERTATDGQATNMIDSIVHG